MKKSKILSIVGYVLIVGGLLLVYWSSPLSPTSGTSSNSLPTDYYKLWKTPMIASGHITGSFDVIGNGTVEVFIFTVDQYDKYAVGNDPGGAIAHAIAPQGDFSMDLPGTGVFYLIVAHGPGQNSEQTFTMTYKVTGFVIIYMLVGIILLALGVVMSAFALRMKRSSQEVADEKAAPKTVSDVQVFDGQEKPK